MAELKCETEYEGYRYLVLEDVAQLDHHTRPAFRHFLSFARQPDSYLVTANGRPLEAHGAVLIWGEATLAGKAAVCGHYGFAEVLTVADMVNDLVRCKDEAYESWLGLHDRWCQDLWRGLGLGRDIPPAEAPSLADLLHHEKAIRAEQLGVPPDLILIGTTEQPRSWVRLVDVIAGYLQLHGSFPTAVRLPFASLESLARTELEPHQFEKLQCRFDLVADERVWAATGSGSCEYRAEADGDRITQEVYDSVIDSLGIVPPFYR